jgi:hypothetical protein
MQTTFFKKIEIYCNSLQNQKITFFPKKVLGPFSKMDILKMSIFRKPLLLYFWTFSMILYEDWTNNNFT